MRKLLFVFASVMITLASLAKAPVVTDVSCSGEGVGRGGRVIVRATCSAKKAADVTDADLIRCAVRAIMFQGWTDGNSMGGYDVSASHNALCGNPDVETQHADYFADFFAANAQSSYAQVLEDTRKILKVGKVYNVSALVSVNSKALRQKLERDHIIKKFGEGL